MESSCAVIWNAPQITTDRTLYVILFAAIGVSLTETNVRTNTIAVGVLIAMLLTMIVSLFVGGWETLAYMLFVVTLAALIVKFGSMAKSWS